MTGKMSMSLNSADPCPLVVSVVVNYNNLKDTIECLSSLNESSYLNHKTVLVDNASRDNPVAVLREQFKHVLCIANQTNLGFTGGYNVGIAKALRLCPKYIFLVNNDVVVSRDAITILVNHMENSPRAGLAGPVNLTYDDKNKIHFGGGILNVNTGIVKFLHKNKDLSELKESFIECNFIEGSALFVRSEVIEKTGGFSDVYFLTSEESELCTRITRLGYTLNVVSNSLVWHKVSRSMGSDSELSTYFIYRNKLWFIRRNGSKMRLKDMAELFLYYTVSLASFLIKKRNYGAAKGLVLGVIDFLRGVSGPGRYGR